jgi:hypothetical protein
MEKEVLDKKVKELHDKIFELQRQIKQLQSQYIAEFPIKAGDKCVDGKRSPCWFVRVYFDSNMNSLQYFKVNYPKKDGTRSGHEQNCYSDLVKCE